MEGIEEDRRGSMNLPHHLSRMRWDQSGYEI